MTHRYQSRFMYQLNPLGSDRDYYTLGSLSNKPGRDWSTPRYVRDEPDRFMSGCFGQDEGEPSDADLIAADRDTAVITAGGQVVEPGQEVDIDTEMAAHREIMEVPKTTTAEDLQYYLDEALKYGKTAVSIGGKVYSAYQTAKQIYDQVTGAGSAGGGVAPIPPVPDPTAPLPINVVEVKGARRVTDAQVQATLYHRGLLPASQLSPAARKMVGLPPLTYGMDSKKMLLLVGAAAAAYFLLLKK